ncbi:hypothetical protein R1sor_024774 [Riccia sorocarpa]|uniref:PPC domain-containing protein n=1 Tax=Riccia sorocarpa TaxID=122646 RepID=A0ABD3GS76_9MARC
MISVEKSEITDLEQVQQGRSISYSNPGRPMGRPRGRPKGSKNKPKPQSIIPLDIDNRGDMGMHYLEIQHGDFVIASLTRFASKFVQHGGGLFVMGAKGIVSNVTVLDVMQKRRALVGVFSILAFSGTIGSTRTTSFSITVSDPSFQTWGGIISGDFQAVQGPVVVEAVSYQRLEQQNDQSERTTIPTWLGLGEISRVRTDSQVSRSSRLLQRRNAALGWGSTWPALKGYLYLIFVCAVVTENKLV